MHRPVTSPEPQVPGRKSQNAPSAQATPTIPPQRALDAPSTSVTIANESAPGPGSPIAVLIAAARVAPRQNVVASSGANPHEPCRTMLSPKHGRGVSSQVPAPGRHPRSFPYLSRTAAPEVLARAETVANGTSPTFPLHAVRQRQPHVCRIHRPHVEPRRPKQAHGQHPLTRAVSACISDCRPAGRSLRCPSLCTTLRIFRRSSLFMWRAMAS